MPISSLAQEMKMKNTHDQVGELFGGQDGGETTTTRRRLKDQRKMEMRERYEATRVQREQSDPARIVMSNAYRQQYDEGVEIPLMKTLIGGKYYEAKGRVNELGQPHGMSARMSGRNGPKTAGSPSARVCTTSVSEGVQAATTGSASVRTGEDSWGEDVSATEEGEYVVEGEAPVPPEVPVLPPVPQDDSTDFFGKKLTPKPSKLVPSPLTKIASRSVGVGATVAECGGSGLFRAEPGAGKPKRPKTYDYSAPRHPDAPIRNIQTTTEVQGSHAWEETRQADMRHLPKTGGIIGQVKQPVNVETLPRPETAGSRLSRHGTRPTDTCKFLF